MMEFDDQLTDRYDGEERVQDTSRSLDISGLVTITWKLGGKAYLEYDEVKKWKGSVGNPSEDI